MGNIQNSLLEESILANEQNRLQDEIMLANEKAIKNEDSSENENQKKIQTANGVIIWNNKLGTWERERSINIEKIDTPLNLEAKIKEGTEKSILISGHRHTYIWDGTNWILIIVI
jgi:hypothetical protein